MKIRNDNPHAYLNPPRGGGACADCGRPPEHSLHTYTLPGFEHMVERREAAQCSPVQCGLFFPADDAPRARRMMRDKLLTLELGRELIRKQLGPSVSLEDNGAYVFVLDPLGTVVQSAPSIRRALLKAGVAIPDSCWPFIATGATVIRNGKHIAKAESANMASRIANALNAHKPDKRGR